MDTILRDELLEEVLDPSPSAAFHISPLHHRCLPRLQVVAPPLPLTCCGLAWTKLSNREQQNNSEQVTNQPLSHPYPGQERSTQVRRPSESGAGPRTGRFCCETRGKVRNRPAAEVGGQREMRRGGGGGG
ncbi:hypothetical protein RHGRI_022814 [Rhododendron griersonianum]|uniref:Uncharacterized protein n=1 Tax=Rhododendron griersonianum TaxID=479676 RepID=A0AAV6J5D3_9ERIC|nr:hypothetical protein RHGRI_022814 [Rhododendron griersonianum]